MFLKRIQKKPLTGLLPVPTGNFSSSKGGGKLWHAQTSTKQAYHLSILKASCAPYKQPELKTQEL